MEQSFVTPRRILGLDYGDLTVGVAVSDPSLLIALPLETIERPNEASIKKTVARISQIISDYTVNTIILGYPKNMDGTEGFRCVKTNEFKARLERNFKRINVILWDERLTTMMADRYLGYLNKSKRARVIDQAAASVILQSYLDFLRNNADSDNQEE